MVSKSVKESMIRSYKRNRKKWDCRSKTLRLLKSAKIQIPKLCMKCGKKTKFEIHHAKYPISTREIIIAIREGKIGYACSKKCHKILDLERDNEIKHNCLRCGHIWIAKYSENKPWIGNCPKCSNARWNIPREPIEEKAL